MISLAIDRIIVCFFFMAQRKPVTRGCSGNNLPGAKQQKLCSAKPFRLKLRSDPEATAATAGWELLLS